MLAAPTGPEERARRGQTVVVSWGVRAETVPGGREPVGRVIEWALRRFPSETVLLWR